MGGSLRFEEWHDNGRLVSGVLEKQGPWLQGRLTFVDSQEDCGMLRLRLQGNMLIISNFQPAGEVAWSYDMSAFRELPDSSGGVSHQHYSRKRSEARRSHSSSGYNGSHAFPGRVVRYGEVQPGEVKLPRRVREKLQRAHSQSSQRERERRGRKHRSSSGNGPPGNYSFGTGTSPDAGNEEHEAPVRSEHNRNSDVATKLEIESRPHSSASDPKEPLPETPEEQKERGAPPLPGFLASCCQSTVRPDCECNIRLLAR